VHFTSFGGRQLIRSRVTATLPFPFYDSAKANLEMPSKDVWKKSKIAA